MNSSLYRKQLLALCEMNVPATCILNNIISTEMITFLKRNDVYWLSSFSQEIQENSNINQKELSASLDYLFERKILIHTFSEFDNKSIVLIRFSGCLIDIIQSFNPCISEMLFFGMNYPVHFSEKSTFHSNNHTKINEYLAECWEVACMDYKPFHEIQMTNIAKEN